MNAIVSMVFTPDGETLATIGPENTGILWDLDPQSWQERLCQIVGRNMTRKNGESTCPISPTARPVRSGRRGISHVFSLVSIPPAIC